ncbi:MAG: 30S ribosomal protein S16 [Patescibacteria group bacterium]
MLAIKLKRIGKKHQGSFRIVVTEKRTKLNGRFTDDLGWVNPATDKFDLDKKRAEYWLKVGAQATPTVHNLLVKAGVVSGKKIAVHKQSKKKAEEAKAAPAAAAPAA